MMLDVLKILVPSILGLYYLYKGIKYSVLIQIEISRSEQSRMMRRVIKYHKGLRKNLFAISYYGIRVGSFIFYMLTWPYHYYMNGLGPFE